MSIKEKQDRLPTLYWLPKLHKRPYKARFIANSSSCTTTVLSKLLTSCLTAVKNIGLDTMILFTKGTELTIFGQLKILMMFSINLNLKTFRLLNCLHMASDHNYFSITFRTKTSWEKIADNFAIDAYFLLLMSSFLTFKFIHFTHDHDQLLFLLSSVKVNTCQFIPVTAHVGSLLRGVLKFTFFLKSKGNKTNS